MGLWGDVPWEMVDLWFDPDADAAVAALGAQSALLSRRVNEVLDLIEADPSDPRVRRVRFHRPALWCVTVVAGDDERAILWETHPTEPDAAVIRYVGPASFA